MAFPEGTVLFTRDGTKMGNAIIRRRLDGPEIKKLASSLLTYLTDTGQDMYEVVTDFGNVCRLSTNEINELYLAGPKQDFMVWHTERWERILDLNELVYGHQTRIRPGS